MVCSIKYFPFGATRSGSVPTDKKFTGQRLDGTGLYYYGARYYDPTIGRFVSADTVVSQYWNPQSYNRYSYVTNNPLKYIDPTGHALSSGDGGNSSAIPSGVAGLFWALQRFGFNMRGATITNIPGFGFIFPVDIFVKPSGSLTSGLMDWRAGITLPFGIIINASQITFNVPGKPLDWIGQFYQIMMHELYHWREASALGGILGSWWDIYVLDALTHEYKKYLLKSGLMVILTRLLGIILTTGLSEYMIPFVV